jgi:hypothetical protein
MTINKRIGSINKDYSQSHIHVFADKKTAYNEVRLYSHFKFVYAMWMKMLKNELKQNK